MGAILLKESKQASNLKGENYPLVYYRPVKENLKIEKSRWLIDKEGQLKEFFYHDTVVNKIIFTEEKVREFSLDGHGENLEFEDRNFTIVHNYLIRFWQHFIKADGFALLITLKSYCIDKDYCWPSLSTLQLECGFGSPNTVKKWLSVLESYGFVFRFNCMSADNNKKNMDESPLYKVRRRVPFLPKEYIQSCQRNYKINTMSLWQNICQSIVLIILGISLNMMKFILSYWNKERPLQRKEGEIILFQLKQFMT
jgi:hypothetical protein